MTQANEVYIGTLIQGRERKVSYKSKKVVLAPKDEWVVVKNNHEPIIDERIFYTVQGLIDHKRTGYSESVKTERSKPHLLAGKMMCADCGSTMQRSGASRDGKTHYMRCKTAAKTKNKACTPHCISQEKVENVIRHRIQALIGDVINDDDGSKMMKEVHHQINSAKGLQGVKQKQFNEVEAKIKSIQKNIAMTYADKLNGVISEDDYLNFKEVFEQEKQGYINQKKYLEKELVEYEIRRGEPSDRNVFWEVCKHIDVLTHEVMNDFIDTIQIGEKDRSTNEQEVILNWTF